MRVMRASERLMAIELALEGVLVAFVSVYAPQVGWPQEETDEKVCGWLKGGKKREEAW